MYVSARKAEMTCHFYIIVFNQLVFSVCYLQTCNFDMLESRAGTGEISLDWRLLSTGDCSRLETALVACRAHAHLEITLLACSVACGTVT
jgi:hypothetical protein